MPEERLLNVGVECYAGHRGEHPRLWAHRTAFGGRAPDRAVSESKPRTWARGIDRLASHFDIAFERVGDLVRHPASALLSEMIDYVESLLESFRPEFR